MYADGSSVLNSRDETDGLIERIRESIAKLEPVCIQGGNTKAFYGREPHGSPLVTSAHCGVVAYEPTELVISVRSGTPLAEVEQVLNSEQQMLAFEPPALGESATLGGTIACGFSGPRRPFAGSARDFVLGLRMVNGRGNDLRFGGQVMKNVAGYDVSRLMVGSMGTLGLILEVSLKVLPLPQVEKTLSLDLSESQAEDFLAAWSQRPSPLSATCCCDGELHIRLSGSEKGVANTAQIMGGETVTDGDQFWAGVKEHRHRFFNATEPLWRISVPPATPALALDGTWLTEWAGGLRWLFSNASAQDIRMEVARAGGHATLFRPQPDIDCSDHPREEIFHPLDGALMRLHQRTKSAFDSDRIFNPGRMYAEI